MPFGSWNIDRCLFNFIERYILRRYFRGNQNIMSKLGGGVFAPGWTAPCKKCFQKILKVYIDDQVAIASMLDNFHVERSSWFRWSKEQNWGDIWSSVFFHRPKCLIFLPQNLQVAYVTKIVKKLSQFCWHLKKLGPGACAPGDKLTFRNNSCFLVRILDL